MRWLYQRRGIPAVRVVLLLIGFTYIMFTSCGFSSTKSPEELRKDSLVQERSHPENYLIQEGRWRKNIIGQTVLEGTITSKATVADFKDVQLQVVWLTKTNTELRTNIYPVFEYFAAGKTVPYKIKAVAPSGTSNIRVTVHTAAAVN
ncbi:MAG: hypothetical protein H7Y03_03865 [Chitinophagaceae bacterium]|nr:hypothetical protein [Chitinophagaceae bacterium]